MQSLREWHKGFLEIMFREGQDRPAGWRAERPELNALLMRRPGGIPAEAGRFAKVGYDDQSVREKMEKELDGASVSDIAEKLRPK